jgi:hypothetical protein
MRYALLLGMILFVGCQSSQVRRVGLTVRHPDMREEYELAMEFGP